MQTPFVGDYAYLWPYVVSVIAIGLVNAGVAWYFKKHDVIEQAVYNVLSLMITYGVGIYEFYGLYNNIVAYNRLRPTVALRLPSFTDFTTFHIVIGVVVIVVTMLIGRLNSKIEKDTSSTITTIKLN